LTRRPGRGRAWYARAALIGGFVAAVGCKSSPPPDANKERAVAAPATAVVAFTPAAWQPGERRRYKLTFRSALTPEGTAEQLTLGWTGTLTLTALTVHDGRAELAAVFAGKAETNQDKTAIGDLERGLREPFYPVVAADGTVREVGFSAHTPTAVAAGWKSLLSDLQFAAGSGPGGWSSEEDDTVGRYQARYAPAGAPGAWNPPGAWKKTKVGYLSTSASQAAGQPQARYLIEKAEGTFRFDAGARLVGVEAVEKIQTKSEPPIPSFLADTQLSLALEEAGTAAADLVEAARRGRGEARFAALTAGPDERMRRDELDRGALAKVSVPELFANLDAGVPRTPAEQDRRARVLKLLGALLRQHPERAADIEQRARAPKANRNELYEVLRDGGTAEAQDALYRLMKLASLDVQDRTSAEQSLGMVKLPTAATMARLQAAVDDPKLGNQARYSLGSAALRVRATDPAAAAKALRFLLDRLAHATGTDDTVAYLQALGNTADPGMLPELERRIASPKPEVHAAAIFSLRSIDSPRVEDLLAPLAAATDEADRILAVKTLAFRPLTARSEGVLAFRLHEDPSARVREELIRATERLLPRSRVLRDAFDWCAHNDAAPALREAASRALSGARPAVSSAP